MIFYILNVKIIKEYVNLIKFFMLNIFLKHIQTRVECNVKQPLNPSDSAHVTIMPISQCMYIRNKDRAKPPPALPEKPPDKLE